MLSGLCWVWDLTPSSAPPRPGQGRAQGSELSIRRPCRQVLLPNLPASWDQTNRLILIVALFKFQCRWKFWQLLDYLFLRGCLLKFQLSSSFPDFLGGAVVNNPPANAEDQVWSLGQEDPLEEEMAAHSSTLAWEMPRTEEPGGLQSMGSDRVGHDWAHTYIRFPT